MDLLYLRDVVNSDYKKYFYLPNFIFKRLFLQVPRFIFIVYQMFVAIKVIPNDMKFNILALDQYIYI